jgi:hypothetical protein
LVAGCAGGSDTSTDARSAALEEMLGGEGASLERGLQRQDDLAFAVTECMLQEGYELEEFEHLLITRDAFEAQIQHERRLTAIASEAGRSFEEYYGYGITTAVLPIEFQEYGLKTGYESLAELDAEATNQSDLVPDTRAEVADDFFGDEGRPGCFATSIDRVEVQYPEMKYAERIGEELSSRVSSDGRIVDATSRRDQCLADDGYDPPEDSLPSFQSDFGENAVNAIAQYETLGDLSADMVDRISEIQSHEIDLAKAVRDCDTRVSLRSLFAEVHREIYEELATDREFASIADEYLASKAS